MARAETQRRGEQQEQSKEEDGLSHTAARFMALCRPPPCDSASLREKGGFGHSLEGQELTRAETQRRGEQQEQSEEEDELGHTAARFIMTVLSPFASQRLCARTD